MEYKTKKCITDKNGNEFNVGDKVTIRYPNGGGSGGCTITKITDTGFHLQALAAGGVINQYNTRILQKSTKFKTLFVLFALFAFDLL